MITFLARYARLCTAILIAVSSAGVTAAPGRARECIARPACESLKLASIVLVADVTSAGQPAVRVDEREAYMIPQRVQLKVVERFKGVSADQRELDANIAIRGMESVFLAQGQRYLVFAVMREDGTLETACSGTKPIEAAAEDLKQLRQCRLPARAIRAVPQPELADQESYAVYAAVVQQATRHKEDPVLINDITSAYSSHCVPRIDPGLTAWKEAADDFLRRRGSRLQLVSKLPLANRYRLLSADDLRNVIRARKPTEIVRHMQFSAVGFDSSRTRAMVQRDHLCGNYVDCADGETVLLEKQTDGWRIVSPKGVGGCYWIS